MEVALRRLEGVDKIAISIPNQTFQVTLEGGAAFDPAGIREAVGKADVGVLRFAIAARGSVRVEDQKRFFVAGKDKFLLVNSADVPTDTPVSIQGLVDDLAKPWELRIRQSKPVKAEASRNNRAPAP